MVLFSSLSAAACFVLLAATPGHSQDANEAVKRAADFSFDLFSGPQLQDETSTKSPSELEYTTGGGVPYVFITFILLW